MTQVVGSMAMVGDHGYRRAELVAAMAEDSTRVITPVDLRKATMGTTEHRKLRKLLAKRSRIQAVIGHLKAEYRLCRNYLHGILGDELNVLLALWDGTSRSSSGFFGSCRNGC